MRPVKASFIFFSLLICSVVNANSSVSKDEKVETQNEIDNVCSPSFGILLSDGLRTHPSIDVSRRLIKGADLQLSSARWGYYPTPSIDISSSSSRTKTVFRLEQPLWSGGRIDAIYDKAKAQKSVALYTHNESQYKLIENYLNTLQRYLQAQGKIKILNNGKKQLDSLMTTLDRMIKVGELSKADKNLLNTRLADIHSNLVITKAEFETSKIQFEILTGRKSECGIIFENAPVFGDDINIEEMVDDMLAFHPTLKILEFQIKSAQSEIVVSKSKLWPSLTLRAEHRKGALYENDIDKEENLVYLTFTMSTGAGASALSNVERSKVNVLKIKSEKLSEERQIVDKLMNNYTRFVAVKNNKEILTKDVKVAEKVYESNKRLFFMQQKKWIDTVNALTALNKKEINKLRLTAEYQVLDRMMALQTGRLSLETGEKLGEVLQ